MTGGERTPHHTPPPPPPPPQTPKPWRGRPTLPSPSILTLSEPVNQLPSYVRSFVLKSEKWRGTSWSWVCLLWNFVSVNANRLKWKLHTDISLLWGSDAPKYYSRISPKLCCADDIIFICYSCYLFVALTTILILLLVDVFQCCNQPLILEIKIPYICFLHDISCI